MSTLDEPPAAAQPCRALIDAVPVGICQAGPAGGCLLVNERWRELSGLSSAESAGHGWTAAIHPDDRERVVAGWLAMVRGAGEFSDVEYRFLRRDGSVVWVAGEAVALRNGFGGVTGFLGVCIDLTERHKAEAALRESRRRAEARLEASMADLERFAHVASHDLQERQRAVTGFLELLERSHGDRLDEEGMHFVRAALANARRMQKPIKGLLGLSLPSSEEPSYETVDVGALVGGAVRDLREAVDESGASVTISELPQLRADRGQLAHVLRSLIATAIEFRSGEPPRVTVQGRELGRDSWEISVAAPGVGIDPQQAERALEGFGALDSGEESAGPGIGLALCRRIVERQGGSIRAEPLAPRGTRFVLSLTAPPSSGDRPVTDTGPRPPR